MSKEDSGRYRFVLDESPRPGCDVPGFPIQVWHEGEQMMQCDSEDCRVEEYRMIQPGTAMSETSGRYLQQVANAADVTDRLPPASAGVWWR